MFLNVRRARCGKKFCEAAIGSADFQTRSRTSTSGRLQARCLRKAPKRSREGSSPVSPGEKRVSGSKAQPSRWMERRAPSIAAFAALK